MRQMWQKVLVKLRKIRRNIRQHVVPFGHLIEPRYCGADHGVDQLSYWHDMQFRAVMRCQNKTEIEFATGDVL